MSRATILLQRFAYSPMGTFGRLILPKDGYSCFTVERPWMGNRQNVSCIPEGRYVMRKRYSPVVERTSGGDYTEGWQVTEVPERTFIMLHPGNHMENVEGCIAVGKGLGFINGKWAVTSSRDAFREVMEALTGTEYDIDIRQIRADYP